MEAIAKTKYLKGSPRKTRLVIDMIRGRKVGQAKAILKFTDKRAAHPIAKCLDSALANAVHLAELKNISVDPDDFFVKSCFVDMGPTKGRKRVPPLRVALTVRTGTTATSPSRFRPRNR